MRFRKPPEKQCPFLEGHGCSIHPAKPTQCRTFPFWPELVESKREWNRTGKYCPGIGKGPLIQIGTAMEIADAVVFFLTASDFITGQVLAVAGGLSPK